MAVQAQYPSNVLLLNRNGQEATNDYFLQPQGGGEGGAFLNQSHMFHNRGVNPRKRGRNALEVEVGGGSTPTTATNAAGGGVTLNPPLVHAINNNNNNQKQSSLLQSQPHQLIDLSQLHHPTPNIRTGLRLSFSDHHPPQLHPYPNHHHHHHHHQQQQQQQQSFVASQSLLMQDCASLIKRHRDELDQFLQAEREELRRTLAEKRRNHYRALLLAAEESITRRLREKESDVDKATRRNAELEARAESLTLEVQVWQAKARAHEAAVATLQAQLQQAILSRATGKKAEDGSGVEGQAEDAESAYVDPGRDNTCSLSCKSCGERVARVVVLPCRHLCLCSECDEVVQACPVCLHVKNSSVQVFLC